MRKSPSEADHGAKAHDSNIKVFKNIQKATPVNCDQILSIF